MSTSIDILKQYWGYDAFRPMQQDIIDAVLQKQDTLALLPTGGGKSICFQVPAMMLEGVCIVITPLIALMKDQVEQLKRRGIKAAAIYSGMRSQEIDYTLDNFIYGDFKFLYVSPERLQTELMRERAKKMKIALLVVDEAHCVSEWGHDFRPPYLRIPQFRDIINKVPLIALTATATEDARKDIITKLDMKNPRVFVQSFSRANISYSVFEEESKERKLYDILSHVQGTAIVYVRSRKRTKELAEWLSRNNIKADFYHAGLSNIDRFKKQDAWINNQNRVIVATNAFGMGIDKPDVRVVVHLDFPENLEAYYQESGRAGRDGKKSYAVLLYDKGDIETIDRNIQQKFPTLDQIRRIYQALANYYKLAVGSQPIESFDFDLQEFLGTFGLSANETHYALKKLESEGFILLNDAYYSPSKFYFTVDSQQFYNFQLRNQLYEKFTKLLLRMYGGQLFTDYVTISESSIAKNFYVSTAEVEKMFEFLHENEIGIYQKQRSKPQLTFLTIRHDAAYLPIDYIQYENRKKIDTAKAQSVVSFAKEKRRCRMLLLQEYFDEHSEKECGVCDNCLSKKKSANSNEFYEKYRQKILGLVPITINELQEYAYFSNKEWLADVLRKMIEDEELSYSEMGVLQKRR